MVYRSPPYLALAFVFLSAAICITNAASLSPWPTNLTSLMTPGQVLYGALPGETPINLTNILGPNVYADASLELKLLNSSHGLVQLRLFQCCLENVSKVAIWHAPMDANAASPSISFTFPVSETFQSTVFSEATAGVLLLDAIYGSPQSFYIQITTLQLPDGALRGQLVDNSSANGVGVSASQTLQTNLTGDLVFPTSNPSYFDTAEFKAFVVASNTNNSTTTLYFTVTTSLFLTNVTAVDVYSGKLNSYGSLTVDLSSFIRFSSLNANHVFRGRRHINASQMKPILMCPSSYYVQIKTRALPQGAVRGQIQLIQLIGVTPLPSLPSSIPLPPSPFSPPTYFCFPPTQTVSPLPPPPTDILPPSATTKPPPPSSTGNKNSVLKKMILVLNMFCIIFSMRL